MLADEARRIASLVIPLPERVAQAHPAQVVRPLVLLRV